MLPPSHSISEETEHHEVKSKYLSTVGIQHGELLFKRGNQNSFVIFFSSYQTQGNDAH